MQDTLNVFLILVVVLKVVDFANMQIIDYVLLTLFAVNIAVTIISWAKKKR